MIWAWDDDKGIGKGGKLPWHLKEDLLFFKEQTLGKTVLMGRTTYDSLPPNLLPGREMIVLTTKPLTDERVTVINSLADLPDKDLVVIGGKTLYEQLINKADQLIVTEIEGSYATDTRLDGIGLDQFKVTNERVLSETPKAVARFFERI